MVSFYGLQINRHVNLNALGTLNHTTLGFVAFAGGLIISKGSTNFDVSFCAITFKLGFW